MYKIINIEYKIDNKRMTKKIIVEAGIEFTCDTTTNELLLEIIKKQLSQFVYGYEQEFKHIVNDMLDNRYRFSGFTIYPVDRTIRIELEDHTAISHSILPYDLIHNILKRICAWLHARHVEPILDFISIYRAYLAILKKEGSTEDERTSH